MYDDFLSGIRLWYHEFASNMITQHAFLVLGVYILLALFIQALLAPG